MDDPEREEMEPGAELARVAGRGVRVGAYEGLRAGEAIVTVRERGLRPSLERVEGYAEDRHGFVVSQEPVAESEVAADSQVFLYIGAPARTVAESEATGRVAEEEEATTGVGVDESTVALEPVGGDAFDEEFDWDAGAAGGERDERDEDEAAGAEPGSVDEVGSVEEPGSVDEPARVWRGPAPGSGLRRGFAEDAGGWDQDERVEYEEPRTRGWLAGVPLGVKVAAWGLLACAVLTLLVSVAARSGDGATSGRGGRAARVAAGSRVAREARARGIDLAPRRVGRAAGRRQQTRKRAWEARPVKEVVRVVVVRPPAGTAGGEAADGSAPSTAELHAAEEEHAAREFGP
jgi:hypothetical protein